VPIWAGGYGPVMVNRTSVLWEKQDSHKGDRKRLFTAIRDHLGDCGVLYPGSYVDVAPSFVFSSVTYVDLDLRAARFFADGDGVTDIITSEGGPVTGETRFVHGDYTTDLGLEAESFDLLVSLYAGFVSEACTETLKVGGVLLVAPSHGDAAMASINPRYVLTGVVTSRSGTYRVSTHNLGGYLVPKTEVTITPTLLHNRRRGIPYTKSPFAYLFTRTN
jgi:hypothetical protein